MTTNEFAEDSDPLEAFLDQEDLVLVSKDFMSELVPLMEAYVLKEAGVSKSQFGEYVDRLEELIGSEAIIDLSLEGLVEWVKTLNN
jgi:hypothetical protein